MLIKEGDPILSRDGKRIAAYWAQSIELGHGNSILFSMLRNMNIDITKGGTPETDLNETHLEICVHFEAPDRTYWRENSFGNVDGWEQMRQFRPAPCEPGPSPAGLTAAYDLVLADLDRFGSDYELRAAKTRRSFHAARANYNAR